MASTVALRAMVDKSEGKTDKNPKPRNSEPGTRNYFFVSFSPAPPSKKAKEVKIMIAEAGFWNTYWWIFPLGMMLLCFLTMRGKGMCGMHSWSGTDSSETAREILDRRYALGEIDRAEYEEKMRDIGRGNGQ